MTNRLVKKIQAIILSMALLLCLVSPQPARAMATAWPDIVGFTYKQALEEAREAFLGTMLANLKIMASRLLKDRIEMLLTGTNSSALYITNYQQFIYASSSNTSKVYMDNFFNSLAGNVSSTAGQMLMGTKRAVDNEIFGAGMKAQSTIDNYVSGGVQNVFDQNKGGGYKAYMEALNNPYNNPYGSYLASSQMARSQLLMNQDVARVQAMNAGGYISAVDPKTNIIKTPAATIKDMVSYVESLPMQIMAQARHIPEVIGTMAAQVLTQTIQTGISKVTQPIDNQLRNVNSTVNGGIYKTQEQIYQGIKFTN